MIKKLLKWDVKVSQKLLLKNDQPLFKKIASILAHSGDSWYIEIFLFTIWLFSENQIHTISAFFAGSVVIQALLVICIKFLIKRERPKSDWGSIYRNTDPNSFPSGHAARVIMLAVLAFGFSLPLLGLILVLWGLFVSFARVSLGVHYLVDIFVGWIIGILLGLSLLATQKFIFNIFPFVF